MERPANMMPNGMAAQQHMNTMQRPQSGNPQQQLYAQILTNVKNKTSQLPAGWPTTFDPGQRAANIMQVVTALRMMGQDTMKCMQIAETFEERCIHESNTKDIYQQRIQSKLQEIHTKRSQNPMAPQMQQGNMGMPMNMNNGNMGMQQNMGNMGGMNMMQNNGMANMTNMGMNGPNQGANMSAGQNGSNQQNQSFPTQLQRPMQASPLPPQQQAHQPNGTLNPAALQNTQVPGQNGGMANANVQQSNAGQGQQANVPHAQVVAMAKQLLASTPDDKKAQMRQQLMNGMDANRRQQLMASNSDPLVQYFMNQARGMLSKRLAAQRDQQTAQSGGMQMGNGMGGASMQQTPSQSGGQNFDFGSILGQQADAIKLQESGEQVVPASNNGKNNNNNNNNNNASYSATNGPGNVSQSQGANPQGIMSQSQSSNNVQYQQFLAMQQEKQRQQQGRTQQQNQMAQNQAMMQQQAQQLRGQPGGLNVQNAFNGGQVNGPAMNMLNRPMQPPGQPSTPQPQANRQGMPPTPVSGANQIAQHHQTMLNQNQNQSNQYASAAQMSRRDQMINQLPPALRDKISGLPPQQLDMALAKIFAQRNQNNDAAGNQQAMNMGTFQMSNQQQQNANMMQANLGSAVPNFNSQPQQQGQQAQADQTLQMQQRLQQHQQNQVRQRAMDFMPFPQNLLSTLGLAVPDGVDQWGSLKQHVNQTQAVLPQNTLAKLQSAQHQYFQQNPAEMQRAMQQLQQRMQQHAASQQGSAPQQTPSARPPSSMAMPNGQAPQAQMIPPNLSMQQQQQGQGQGAKGGNASQQPVRVPPPQLPTNQEIEMFKQKFPGARNLTDDQLRQMIYQKKVAAANEQAAQVQQQLAFQNQMQRAQAGNNNAGQMGNVPQSNQQQPPRPQQQQPAQAQAPKPANAQGVPQGQKRPQPSTDDVMEIPNPNPPSKAAMQAPAMQTNLSQQQQPQGGMRMPTQEELSKMTAPQQEMARHQMRQMEALRKAQASGRQQPPQPQTQAQAQAQAQAPQQQQQQSVQQPTAQNAGSNVSGAETALRQKIAALYKEINAAHPKGPAVQLDAKSKEQVQASLKKLWAPSVNLPQSFLVAIRHPQFGEQRVRETIRNIIIVQQNAIDASGNARDFYSVTPADMRQIEAFYAKYFTDMKAVQQGQKNNAKQQNQKTATATTTATPQQPRPQQPSKQQQQTSQKPAGPARKASAANTKAPPAPTDNKTFDWGSPSPHGVPKYQASGNELTMDKLKMPATKKRKTGPQSDNQVSSPAAQTATPKVADNKAQSQAQDTRTKPQAQPQQPKPTAPEPTKYKCDDVFCDASVKGFDTELQLKEHWEAEHKPVEDPMKFLLDSAAKALDVDQDGNPLATKKNASGPSQPHPASAARPLVKKGPTPMSKQSSATPTPGGKASATPAEKKPANAIPEAKKTLMGTMAGKVGFDLPAKPAEEPAAPGIVDEDEDRAWIDNLQESLSDLKEFVDPWAHLAQITNWDMGTELQSSPEPTPSDETSESSRESDISLNDRMRINFEWNAFGDSSTYVPEALRMDSLGLSESRKLEDVTMEDGNEGEKSDKQDKQKTSDWDWTGDAIDWDSWMDQ